MSRFEMLQVMDGNSSYFSNYSFTSPSFSAIYTTPSPSLVSNHSTHVEDKCPQPAVGFLFWVAVEILTTSLGIPSNLRVLWALLRGEADACTSNVFIGSLATLDTIQCLLFPVHTLNYLLLDHAAVVRLLPLLFGLNEVGSPLFLSCICLDRYAAVCHPVAFLRFRNGRYRVGCTVAVWAFTLSYSVLIVAIQFEHSDCITVALFTVAFIILMFCNISILRALRQSGPGHNEVHPVKERAFRMVLGIFTLVLFCFLPTVVLYPYEHVLPTVLFNCYIYPICYSFTCLRASLQPLLYLSRAGKLPCCSAKHNCA